MENGPWALEADLYRTCHTLDDWQEQPINKNLLWAIFTFSYSKYQEPAGYTIWDCVHLSACVRQYFENGEWSLGITGRPLHNVFDSDHIITTRIFNILSLQLKSPLWPVHSSRQLNHYLHLYLTEKYCIKMVEAVRWLPAEMPQTPQAFDDARWKNPVTRLLAINSMT